MATQRRRESGRRRRHAAWTLVNQPLRVSYQCVARRGAAPYVAAIEQRRDFTVSTVTRPFGTHMTLVYSPRNAVTGFTRAARDAGMSVAIDATANTINATSEPTSH